MLLARKFNYSMVMLLLNPLGLILSSQSILGEISSPQASGRVFWSPETLGSGDTITITFDTSDPSALFNTRSSAASLSLLLSILIITVIYCKRK